MSRSCSTSTARDTSEVRGGLQLGLIYVLGAACGVLLIIAGIKRGTWSDALTGVVILVVVAGLSPIGWRLVSRLFPQSHDPAELAGAHVVIYWRPLCAYCQRLRMRLGSSGKDAVWVNIWRDSEAAARIRAVNGGNETVPTVLIDGEAHTNPDPETVRRALAPTF